MKNVPPKHIAIIMDGNGRWAQEKGKLRAFGHEEGGKRVDEIVTHSAEIGVKYLSLFAFSTENWTRPAIEVQALMYLLRDYLSKMDKKLIQNRISLRAQGSLHRLPEDVQIELHRVIAETSFADPRMVLNVCLSYGGREEIVEAAKKIAIEVSQGKYSIDEITEKKFQNALYQPDIPDPDLLIRTGGESRVSNFLLWQLAYTEIYLTQTFWPDFHVPEYDRAIQEFMQRERRFGQ